jgi:hypothetical protein
VLASRNMSGIESVRGNIDRVFRDLEPKSHQHKRKHSFTRFPNSPPTVLHEILLSTCILVILNEQPLNELSSIKVAPAQQSRPVD